MEGNLNIDKTSVSPKNNFWVWIVVALSATVSSIAMWGDSQKDKLITNYKDDKTVLLFLLNDKKVVPDCLINIPEDIIFIKYLIKNNLYDFGE